MPPAARVTDISNHGGTLVGPGAPTVLIGGMPAAVMGDTDQATRLLQQAFTENFPNVESWTSNELRREQDFLALQDSEAFKDMLRPKG